MNLRRCLTHPVYPDSQPPNPCNSLFVKSIYVPTPVSHHLPIRSPLQNQCEWKTPLLTHQAPLTPNPSALSYFSSSSLAPRSLAMLSLMLGAFSLLFFFLRKLLQLSPLLRSAFFSSLVLSRSPLPPIYGLLAALFVKLDAKPDAKPGVGGSVPIVLSSSWSSLLWSLSTRGEREKKLLAGELLSLLPPPMLPKPGSWNLDELPLRESLLIHDSLPADVPVRLSAVLRDSDRSSEARGLHDAESESDAVSAFEVTVLARPSRDLRIDVGETSRFARPSTGDSGASNEGTVDETDVAKSVVAVADGKGSSAVEPSKLSDFDFDLSLDLPGFSFSALPLSAERLHRPLNTGAAGFSFPLGGVAGVGCGCDGGRVPMGA